MAGTATLQEFSDIFFQDYGVKLSPAQAVETLENFKTAFKAASLLTIGEKKTKHGK